MSAAIESKIKKVEAYSPEYFDLLAKAPQLAQVLALGENVLFGTAIRSCRSCRRRAAPESRPATGTGNPLT